MAQPQAVQKLQSEFENGSSATGTRGKSDRLGSRLEVAVLGLRPGHGRQHIPMVLGLRVRLHGGT